MLVLSIDFNNNPMTAQDSINEIFFKFLMQYQFEEQDLDYTLLDK